MFRRVEPGVPPGSMPPSGSSSNRMLIFSSGRSFERLFQLGERRSSATERFGVVLFLGAHFHCLLKHLAGDVFLAICEQGETEFNAVRRKLR